MAKDDLALANAGKALTSALSEKSRAKKRNNTSKTKLDAIADMPKRNSQAADLKIVLWKTADLHAPKINIRKIEPDHVSETAQSLAMFGQVKPVLITSTGEIVDGVILVEAARKLGHEELDCCILDHLSSSEMKRLRATLNRLGEKGTYDMVALKQMLDDITLEEETIEIPGFEPEILDQILQGDEPEYDTKANAQERPGEEHPAVATLGDAFALGNHRLVCGDACNSESYKALFENNARARLIFTDFPYGCPNDGFTGGKGKIHHRDFVAGTSDLNAEELHDLITKSLGAALEWLIAGGLIFSFMDWRGIETLLCALRMLGLNLLTLAVWNKGKGGMGGLYRNAHELIAVAKYGIEKHLNRVGLGKFGRDRTNVMDYPGATTPGSSAHKVLADHPTPKSVELIADMILDVTERGDIVLDPFAGSGTIFIAAEKTGRRAYGIELDPLYVDLIIRRFEKFTDIEAIHVESGKTYSALAEARAADQNKHTDHNGDDDTDEGEICIV